MFILCNECHQHYDDSTQVEECAGIGQLASEPSDGGSSHALNGLPHPATEHNANAVAAAMRYTKRA